MKHQYNGQKATDFYQTQYHYACRMCSSAFPLFQPTWCSPTFASGTLCRSRVRRPAVLTQVFCGFAHPFKKVMPALRYVSFRDHSFFPRHEKFSKMLLSTLIMIDSTAIYRLFPVVQHTQHRMFCQCVWMMTWKASDLRFKQKTLQ